MSLNDNCCNYDFLGVAIVFLIWIIGKCYCDWLKTGKEIKTNLNLIAKEFKDKNKEFFKFSSFGFFTS